MFVSEFSGPNMLPKAVAKPEKPGIHVLLNKGSDTNIVSNMEVSFASRAIVNGYYGLIKEISVSKAGMRVCLPAKGLEYTAARERLKNG